MPGKYILDEHGEPIAETDLMKWAHWIGDGNHTKVAHTIGTDADGAQVSVSTIFLGLDHAWGGGPPVLWETMIFGGVHHQDCERCAGSREQALAMHEASVAKLGLVNAFAE